MPEVTSAADTGRRKDDHIRINLEENVQFPRLTTGLEKLHFMHQAVPELDLQAIDTRTVFLGKTLRNPLLISSMTGGTDRAGQINMTLAEAAQNAGVAMGLGIAARGVGRPGSGCNLPGATGCARYSALRQPGSRAAQLWFWR